MLLTSQIKELGAILQKLINEPGLIQINENNEHLMASMAMRMSLDFLTKNWGLGSGQRRKRMKIGVKFSQELEK